jgi:hypothetical protein
MSSYPQKPVAVRAKALFRWATISWFSVFLVGQLFFAVYIILRYWRGAYQGHFERWNHLAPNLYFPGNPFRSALFGLHALIAAVVSLLGPLQLIPELRRRAPRLHRICGRIYIYFAFAIGLDGIILVWRPGATGDHLAHAIVSVNALIILLCAFFAIRTAMKRDIRSHNRWAVHLFIAMSGVWMFRIFLMLWLTIWGKPVGFDPDPFTGPFLIVLGLFVYIFPQLVVLAYFKAREAKSPGRKLPFSLLLLLVAAAMVIGLYGAIMKMWLPRM